MNPDERPRKKHKHHNKSVQPNAVTSSSRIELPSPPRVPPPPALSSSEVADKAARKLAKKAAKKAAKALAKANASLLQSNNMAIDSPEDSTPAMMPEGAAEEDEEEDEKLKRKREKKERKEQRKERRQLEITSARPIAPVPLRAVTTLPLTSKTTSTAVVSRKEMEMDDDELFAHFASSYHPPAPVASSSKATTLPLKPKTALVKLKEKRAAAVQAAVASKGKEKVKGKGKEKEVKAKQASQSGTNKGKEVVDESEKILSAFTADGTRNRSYLALDVSGLSGKELLSTVWLGTQQLARIVSVRGPSFIVKRGKFSKAEDETIREVVKEYQEEHGLDDTDMQHVIHPTVKGKREHGLWFKIAAALENRPLFFLFNHVRRMYDPLQSTARWTPAADELLKQSVLEYGLDWVKASEATGRMLQACRDRYRDMSGLRGYRADMTEEENDALRECVRVHGEDNWKAIAKSMAEKNVGPVKRTSRRLQEQWNKVLNTTTAPVFGLSHGFVARLAVALDKLNVNHESEVNFNLVEDPMIKASGNTFFKEQLRRFLNWGREATGKEDFKDVVAWMLQKWPDVDSVAPIGRKSSKGMKKRFKAERQEEDDAEYDEEELAVGAAERLAAVAAVLESSASRREQREKEKLKAEKEKLKGKRVISKEFVESSSEEEDESD